MQDENKQCEICGSTHKVYQNGATGMYLCVKHRRQVYKYGKITDESAYNITVPNEIKKSEQFYTLMLRDKFGNVQGESIFDADDLQIVRSRNKWTIGNHGYVTSGAGKEQVLLHRLIAKATDEDYVDHINQDKLDNRKCNLRICTNQENNRNKDLYSSNTSGVTGVTFDNDRKLWIAQIVVDDRNIHLGRFKEFEDAVKARLNAERRYFGEFMPEKNKELMKEVKTDV